MSAAEVRGALEGVDVRLGSVRLVGSHAYGTAGTDSDYDYRGFYIASKEDCLRLKPPQEQYERKDPDLVIFELRKFVKLAAACNPNVLEVLWAQPVIDTPAGQRITAARRAFLSTRAFHTYGGYAKSQLEKAQLGIQHSRRREHRRAKNILHLFRLYEQGIDLLRTGDMSIRVKDPERLWAQAEWPLDKVEREFLKLDAEMHIALAESPLPKEPDWERLDELLTGERH